MRAWGPKVCIKTLCLCMLYCVFYCAIYRTEWPELQCLVLELLGKLIPGRSLLVQFLRRNKLCRLLFSDFFFHSSPKRGISLYLSFCLLKKLPFLTTIVIICIHSEALASLFSGFKDFVMHFVAFIATNEELDNLDECRHLLVLSLLFIEWIYLSLSATYLYVLNRNNSRTTIRIWMWWNRLLKHSALSFEIIELKHRLGAGSRTSSVS